MHRPSSTPTNPNKDVAPNQRGRPQPGPSDRLSPYQPRPRFHHNAPTKHFEPSHTETTNPRMRSHLMRPRALLSECTAAGDSAHAVEFFCRAPRASMRVRDRTAASNLAARCFYFQLHQTPFRGVGTAAFVHFSSPQLRPICAHPNRQPSLQHVSPRSDWLLLISAIHCLSGSRRARRNNVAWPRSSMFSKSPTPAPMTGAPLPLSMGPAYLSYSQIALSPMYSDASRRTSEFRLETLSL